VTALIGPSNDPRDRRLEEMPAPWLGFAQTYGVVAVAGVHVAGKLTAKSGAGRPLGTDSVTWRPQLNAKRNDRLVYHRRHRVELLLAS
jgi:hypothetical protein